MSGKTAGRTHLSVKLTAEQLAFVQDRASEEAIPPREYVEGLIAEAQRRQERLQALLLEGINSGPGIEADEAYWETKGRKFREKYGEAFTAD